MKKMMNPTRYFYVRKIRVNLYTAFVRNKLFEEGISGRNIFYVLWYYMKNRKRYTRELLYVINAISNNINIEEDKNEEKR